MLHRHHSMPDVSDRLVVRVASGVPADSILRCCARAALGVASLELCGHVLEAQAAALQEEQEVIEQVGGLGDELLVCLRHGGESNFEALPRRPSARCASVPAEYSRAV